jgi:copper resistance protein B
MNKIWFKSEGFVENSKATDGDTEALYDHPIPFLRYFDAQAGVRYDLDSNPGRTWGALGLQGLAPYFSISSRPFTSAIEAASRDA